MTRPKRKFKAGDKVKYYDYLIRQTVTGFEFVEYRDGYYAVVRKIATSITFFAEISTLEIENAD